MLSGLTHHQTYSTKCVSENSSNIIQDTKPVVKMLPCSFTENSKSDSITLEDPVDTEFLLITTPVYIIDFKINYVNNIICDDITASTEFTQDHDSVLLPTDEVDECGGHIYEILSHHNHNDSNLEENKYYSCANEHEFWITE